MSIHRCVHAGLFLLLVASVPAVAQQTQAPPPGPTEANYRKARAVLDAAIKAHTGGKPLPGARTIALKLRGGLVHRHQSPNAMGDPVSTPFAGELIWDSTRNWTVWERTSSFPGGIHISNRWLLKGNEGVNVDLQRKTFTAAPNAAAFAQAMLLRVPHYVLQQAQNRAATLRWVGENETAGAKQNVVAFALANGTVYNLYFDATSNLLSRWQTLQSDAMRGDVVNETVFKGYTAVAGMQMPTGQFNRLGGAPTLDVEFFDWRLDESLADSVFATPADVRPAVVTASAAPSAAPAATASPSVQEIGGGLYSIEGFPGYRVLFQEFRDFVMVFEAPQSDQFSLNVIRMVREKTPSKPIRYMAMTHHHDDHAGGFRTYIGHKITVLTTPKNLPFFSASFRSRYTIAPDYLAQNRHPEVSHHLDAIQRSPYTMRNGDTSVELIDIGPSPHAEEMLVFWFPKQRVLFQGDLWNREGDGSTRPATDTTVHFAEWLQKSGLPVERIIGVHGPSGTPAELQQAVQLRRASGN